MEQDIEKENKRLRDLLYSKIMFIEQLKKDYRNLVKDIEEIIKNYNEARDLAIELRDAHETVRKEFLRADKNKDMWREKAERLKEENDGLKSQLDFEARRRERVIDENEKLEDEYSKLTHNYKELQKENAELKAYKDVNEDFKIAWEELKEKIITLEETLQTIEQLKDEDSLRVVQLVEENKRLKEDLKVYHRPDIIKVLTDYRTGELGLLEEKYDTLTNKFFNSETNNYKLKICLQEIKEIAETAINGGYATKSSDYSEGMEIIGHYVMQKITKAEEECEQNFINRDYDRCDKGIRQWLESED